MSVRDEPCPYCEVEIPVLSVFDPERGPNDGQQACPECNAPRRLIEALVDGDITHDDCREQYGRVEIKPKVRRDLQDKRDEMDDPAEENQYLNEYGVEDDEAEEVEA